GFQTCALPISVTGLQLSPDLRWSIIRGLAARDALPLELLDQQRADDNTLTGEAEYLGAKHSFPTEENKRYIFDQLLIPQAYSNAEVLKLHGAFNAPRSASLSEVFA